MVDVSIASASAQLHVPVADDVTSGSNNPFIDAYMKSIQPARDIIANQWRKCIWDQKTLNIEPPASDDEVKALTLQHICYYCCCSCCFSYYCVSSVVSATVPHIS